MLKVYLVSRHASIQTHTHTHTLSPDGAPEAVFQRGGAYVENVHLGKPGVDACHLHSRQADRQADRQAVFASLGRLEVFGGLSHLTRN